MSASAEPPQGKRIVASPCLNNSEADLGTFGTGPFGNDGALDFLDELAGQPAGEHREVLERMFFRVRSRPDLLGWKFFPDEVVAAAAVVAASLPGGEGSGRSWPTGATTWT